MKEKNTLNLVTSLKSMFTFILKRKLCWCGFVCALFLRHPRHCWVDTWTMICLLTEKAKKANFITLCFCAGAGAFFPFAVELAHSFCALLLLNSSFWSALNIPIVGSSAAKSLSYYNSCASQSFRIFMSWLVCQSYERILLNLFFCTVHVLVCLIYEHAFYSIRWVFVFIEFFRRNFWVFFCSCCCINLYYDEMLASIVRICNRATLVQPFMKLIINVVLDFIATEPQRSCYA